MKKNSIARSMSVIALALSIMIMTPIMVSAVANVDQTINEPSTIIAANEILPLTFVGILLLILVGIFVFSFFPNKKKENV